MVIHLDNSGALDTLTGTGSTCTDQGYDPNAKSAGSKVNILNPQTNTSLTGDMLLLPD